MLETVNILVLITEASMVVKVVMGILMLASLIGWLLIFQLSARVSKATNHDERFEEWFWAGKNLSNLFQGIQKLTDRQGLEHIFHAGFAEYLKVKRHNPTDAEMLEIVERKLRVAIGKQHQAMESGIATLASIGSVSPYIGLFGTVWGIMNAFIGLSTAEQVSLSSVAPGIAEALIATAIGLFAAIPAVLAFNHFTSKISTLFESRALFCDELTAMILRDSLANSYVEKQAVNNKMLADENQEPTKENLEINHTSSTNVAQ